MRYLGGKWTIRGWVHDNVFPAIEHCHSYLEPFVGSGAILSVMAPYFESITVGDAHPDLILMWQAIASGWLPPEACTREERDELRDAPPSAVRGLVGFGTSFGGKWFGSWGKPRPGQDGGPYGEARRAVLRLRDTFAKATILHADYRLHSPTAGMLVYCDPPYEGTTGYKGVPPFDSAVFWKVAASWARAGAVVVVSEQKAPAGWIPIATRERASSLRMVRGEARRMRTEVLFTRKAPGVPKWW